MGNVLGVLQRLINLFGFLEGNRSQILAAAKGVIAGAMALGIELPFDASNVQELLTKLLVWFGVLKLQRIYEAIRAFLAAAEGKPKAGMAK